MLISRLIEKLISIKNESGDLPVYCVFDDGCVEYPLNIDTHVTLEEEDLNYEDCPKRVLIGN